MSKIVSCLRVKSGALLENKKEGVFCMFYTKKSMPHLNNKGVENPNLKYPEILMPFRWSCRFGFPGGTVDEDEVSKYGVINARLIALKRELKEEINFDIDPKKLSGIICTHDLGHITVHLYAYEVSQKEIEEIRDGIKDAVDSRSEACGTVLVPCTTYNKIYGLPTFLTNSFTPSVREEMVIALKELGLMTENELKQVCERAGFDYDKLIK